MKIEKNVQPILNVTKNVIKKSDHFYDYYVKENNNLYQNQLPLLMQRSRIREALLYKKLNKDNLLSSSSDQNKDEENKVSPPKLSLSTIRNVHIRSKKLPPLCPFYNKKGDLLPEVVSSSKVFNRNIIQTEANINTSFSTIIASNSLEPKTYRSLLRGGSPLFRDKYNNINFMKNFEINFEEFQKEILYEEKYSTLNYNISEIFGHKDFYQEFSEGLVEEIKIVTSEAEAEENKIKLNEETKKEKLFEWGKNKRNIFLTLSSINIKIKEIVQEDKDKDKTSENKKKKDETCFEYVLPFNLVPLLYYRGIEKFKLFLLSFIKWNEASQKFELSENIPKIINSLLTNCKDLKLEKEDEDDVELEELNVLQPVEFKKNMTINNRLNFSKFEKKNSKLISSMNPFSQSMNLGKDQDKGQLFAGTNVDILSKKRIDKKKYNLYPKEEKDSDCINYNYFKFFWNTSNKLFSVTIETPLISFSIPSYNIFVKQYINYELLFYLFKINFDSWDFYIIKYLSSFKIFRILLSQLTSINPKTNRNFYLENIKSKKFDWSDCSIINIITLEEDKENEDKKEDKINNTKNIILEKIEEHEEEKNEKNEENKDINKDEKEELSIDKQNEENKEENKEEIKNENKEEDKNYNDNENEKSPDNNNTIETQNDVEKEDEKKEEDKNIDDKKEEDNKDGIKEQNQNDGENDDEANSKEHKDEENPQEKKEEENIEKETKGKAAPIPTKETTLPLHTTQKENKNELDEKVKESQKEIEEKEKEKEKDKVIEEKEKEEDKEKENNNNKMNKNLYNSILEQDCFIAIVTLTDTEKSISNQYTIHFNYSHFNKFDSMEKYMKKTSFLLKFLDINYENLSIDFDYESLNTFDEKNWIKENEKYNYILDNKPIEDNTNKEEEKTLNVNKNRAEYAGSLKGTSIIIDIKQPIILLKSIDKNGNLFTKRFAIFYEEEKKLIFNRNDEVIDLSKNIYEITLEHKKREIEEEKNKILSKTDSNNFSKKRLTKK